MQYFPYFPDNHSLMKCVEKVNSADLPNKCLHLHSCLVPLSPGVCVSRVIASSSKARPLWHQSRGVLFPSPRWGGCHGRMTLWARGRSGPGTMCRSIHLRGAVSAFLCVSALWPDGRSRKLSNVRVKECFMVTSEIWTTAGCLTLLSSLLLCCCAQAKHKSTTFKLKPLFHWLKNPITSVFCLQCEWKPSALTLAPARIGSDVKHDTWVNTLISSSSFWQSRRWGCKLSSTMLWHLLILSGLMCIVMNIFMLFFQRGERASQFPVRSWYRTRLTSEKETEKLFDIFNTSAVITLLVLGTQLLSHSLLPLGFDHQIDRLNL